MSRSAPTGEWPADTTPLPPAPLPPAPAGPPDEPGNRIGLGMLLAIVLLAAAGAALAAVLVTRHHHHNAAPTTVVLTTTAPAPTFTAPTQRLVRRRWCRTSPLSRPETPSTARRPGAPR